MVVASYLVVVNPLVEDLLGHTVVVHYPFVESSSALMVHQHLVLVQLNLQVLPLQQVAYHAQQLFQHQAQVLQKLQVFCGDFL